MEIFLRVPARSVGRFRSVSKLYYELLSQPSFAKDHLRYGGGISSAKLIVHKVGKIGIDRFLYYPLDDALLASKPKPDMSEVYYLFDEYLLGSCNGLICKKDEESGGFKLWNPTTREVDCLPQFPDTKIEGISESLVKSYESITRFDHYGFGYDSLNDDYKIVCVICVYNRSEDRVETPLSNTTYIYSHRRRCWKEIDQAFPPYCIPNKDEHNCQFVHGKVHWIAYASQDEKGVKHSQFIVSLDLATEEYGIVPRPPTDHPSDSLDVCVLGGELCFYIDHGSVYYDTTFELWIMREYGVQQSWSHLFTIPYQKLEFIDTVQPLFLMKRGEILLKIRKEVYGEVIYLYNPKTYNFITVIGVSYNASLYGHIYLESLVETTLSNKGQSSLAPA